MSSEALYLRAADAIPDSLRNRLYAESWSDGTGHRAVDLDRAAEITHAEIDPLLREIDEARLELTRWQSMFGDVDTAQARLDGQEAINKELRDENARLTRAYNTVVEGRKHAWSQLEQIIEGFGETAYTVDISADAASLVKKCVADMTAETKQIRAEADRLRGTVIQLRAALRGEAADTALEGKA